MPFYGFHVLELVPGCRKASSACVQAHVPAREVELHEAEPNGVRMVLGAFRAFRWRSVCPPGLHMGKIESRVEPMQSLKRVRLLSVWCAIRLKNSRSWMRLVSPKRDHQPSDPMLTSIRRRPRLSLTRKRIEGSIHLGDGADGSWRFRRTVIAYSVHSSPRSAASRS